MALEEMVLMTKSVKVSVGLFLHPPDAPYPLIISIKVEESEGGGELISVRESEGWDDGWRQKTGKTGSVRLFPLACLSG